MLRDYVDLSFEVPTIVLGQIDHQISWYWVIYSFVRI